MQASVQGLLGIKLSLVCVYGYTECLVPLIFISSTVSLDRYRALLTAIRLLLRVRKIFMQQKIGAECLSVSVCKWSQAMEGQ